MNCFWLGGLSPFRGPAASETLTGRLAESDIERQEGEVTGRSNQPDTARLTTLDSEASNVR
jgi:hypothetical protein